jgi:hypothetical protein
MVTEKNANAISPHDYLAFGEEIPTNTAGCRAEWGSGADNINQKFTGQVRDSETWTRFLPGTLDESGARAIQQPRPDECWSGRDESANLERIRVCCEQSAEGGGFDRDGYLVSRAV